MKLLCKVFGCPDGRAQHALDADFVLHVCERCGKGELEGPATDFDQWTGWAPKGWKPFRGSKQVGVWWDPSRGQARTWI